MIDRKKLLADLSNLLKKLEADLLARSDSDDVPEVRHALREEFDRAKAAERTAMNYEPELFTTNVVDGVFELAA